MPIQLENVQMPIQLENAKKLLQGKTPLQIKKQNQI
jgi:hypothetical protein